MVRNNQLPIIKVWFENTNQIQARKYYSSEELYGMFKGDMQTTLEITMKSFAYRLNQLVNIIERLRRVEIKSRCYRFIILNVDDKTDFRKKIRISQRNRKVTPVNRIVSLAYPNRVLCNTTHEDDNIMTHQTNTRDTTQVNEEVSESNMIADQVLNMKKTDSPMALSFFFGKDRAKKMINKEDGNPTIPKYGDVICDHLQNQVTKLKHAHLIHNGWRMIVNNFDNDETLSEFQVFHLRQKAMYLSKLYELSLQYYNTIKRFSDIAKLAILSINKSLGILDCQGNNHKKLGISHFSTLLEWFRIYRNKDSFPNPSRYSSEQDMHPFLSQNPDVVRSINTYCKANIADISTELVFDHIHDTIIPYLVNTIKNESQIDEYTKVDLLKEYGLKTLTVSTVNVWMSVLGFKYEPMKKCYYVDNHESPENVLYRSKFVTRYFEYEICSYRWYHITAVERERMVQEGILDENLGYKYNDNNVEMVEYHVDDHVLFEKACSSLQFGGYLSVRKPANKKPIMILGQDECIFKQYIFTSKFWVLPDGTKQLVPKDEGQGIMLSSFTCRELGYGYTPSPLVMEAVNLLRKTKKYSDESAATMKNGSPKKPKLTTSPFVRKLEYGNQNEGYWTYECMVLQLEDIIDLLSFEFPSFDFVFLFDHSNGHDRLRPNGLNLNKIGIRYGGKQPIMRNSLLNEKTYFGPYHNSEYTLQPGMHQTMQFNTDDTGPCYLTEEERLVQRLDRDSGVKKTKFATKDELKLLLKGVGILNPVGNKKQLQDRCQQLNIPITKEESKIVEGWVGKQKGALQVLFERGWIDPSNIGQYTAEGKKSVVTGLDLNCTDDDFDDGCGCNFSIRCLMKLQEDFRDEITLLQFHSQNLGVYLDRSPKCHPEIAGEGIEYAWALSKLNYRRAPLVSKRTKAKFQQLVDESTNPFSVLNIQRIRACSRKARSYMKMYRAIQSLDVTDQVAVKSHSILEETIKIYRSLKKTGKSHRSVIDRNRSDVNDIEEAVPLNMPMESNERTIKSELINLLVTKMNFRCQ